MGVQVEEPVQVFSTPSEEIKAAHALHWCTVVFETKFFDPCSVTVHDLSEIALLFHYILGRLVVVSNLHLMHIFEVR